MGEMDWENDEVRMWRANFMACAYNAAVNYGSGRAFKTMARLVEAINQYERVEGHAKLQALVEKGVIDGFHGCAPACHMRPGGLFHRDGCENDMNHPVYKERQQKAREVLPGGRDGNAGWHAASVSLVSRHPNGGDLDSEALWEDTRKAARRTLSEDSQKEGGEHR